MTSSWWTCAPYYLGLHPVTNTQYARFLNEQQPDGSDVSKYIELGKNCSVLRNNSVYEAYGGKEAHPVVQVSWFGAQAYCHWAGLRLPVGRWLAAKAFFASWLVLQGEGLRTAVLGLRIALGVLRAETARGCADAGRPLDPALLKEAIRRADLLLVHLADTEALARGLSRCEAHTGSA